MFFESLPLENQFLQSLGWALVHFVWQGALLGFLAWATLTQQTKRAAVARYWTGIGFLSLMFVTPIATFAYCYATAEPTKTATASAATYDENSKLELDNDVPSPFDRNQLNHLNSEPTIGPDALPIAGAKGKPDNRDGASELVAVDESPGAIANPNQDPIDQTAQAENLSVTQKLANALGMCWAIGVFVLSLRLMLGWLVLQRRKSLAFEVTNSKWNEWFAGQLQQLGCARNTRLLESAHLTVPVALGYLKPVVIVPVSAMTGFSEAQLKALIIHELAHVGRNDYLVNLFQSLVDIVLFYHPAVWWISKQIRIERENCCDDDAVRISGSPLLYAKALTEVAALEQKSGSKFDLAPSAAGGELLMRVQRVLGIPQPARTLPAASLLGLLFVSMAMCGVLLLARPTLGGSEVPIMPENNSASADSNETSESNNGKMVMGIDIESFPAHPDFRKIEDLYQTDPNDPDDHVWHDQVWSAEIDQTFWLKYRADLNRFYIEDHSQKPSVHYGPIPGNPMVELKFESRMISVINKQSLKNKSESDQNPPMVQHYLGQTRRMLTSPHAALIQSGLRIAGSIDRLDYRTLIDFIENVETAQLTMAQKKMDPAALKRLERNHKSAKENLNKQLAKYASVQATIDVASCTASRPPTKYEQESLVWGPEVKGLTMAIGPWRGGDAIRPKKTIVVTNQSQGNYQTLIRNVSTKPIIVSVISTKERPGITVVNTKTGKETMADRVMIGGAVFSTNYLVKPGEVVASQSFAVNYVDVNQKPDEKKTGWWDTLKLQRGETYKLTASTTLPQSYSKTTDGRWLPAKNLWRGTLVSGPLTIAFEPGPLPENVDVEAERPVHRSVDQVQKEFNASMKEIEEAKDQPPITHSEWVTTINQILARKDLTKNERGVLEKARHETVEESLKIRSFTRLVDGNQFHHIWDPRLVLYRESGPVVTQSIRDKVNVLFTRPLTQLERKQMAEAGERGLTLLGRTSSVFEKLPTAEDATKLKAEFDDGKGKALAEAFQKGLKSGKVQQLLKLFDWSNYKGKRDYQKREMNYLLKQKVSKIEVVPATYRSEDLVHWMAINSYQTNRPVVAFLSVQLEGQNRPVMFEVGEVEAADSGAYALVNYVVDKTLPIKKIGEISTSSQLERATNERFQSHLRMIWTNTNTGPLITPNLSNLEVWILSKDGEVPSLFQPIKTFEATTKKGADAPAEKPDSNAVKPDSNMNNGKDGDDDKPAEDADKKESRSRIVDVDGKGVAGAKIVIAEYTYQKEYETFDTTVTDEEGYFSYPAGTPQRKNFFVWVSAKGFVTDRWIGNSRVHVKRAGKTVPDVLKLSRTVTISGKVIGPDGKPISNVPLSLDYKTVRSARINARQFSTDENGKFELTDLPAGTIFVRYERRPNREDPMPKSIQFGIVHFIATDGKTLTDCDLDFSQEPGSIQGKVLGVDGKPMQKAEVTIRWSDVLVNLDHTIRTKTNEKGEFSVSGLKPGKYTVLAAKGTLRYPVGDRVVDLTPGLKKVVNVEPFVRGKAREVKADWSTGDIQYAIVIVPNRNKFKMRDRFKVELIARNNTEKTIDFTHTASFDRLHISNGADYRKLDYSYFTGFPASIEYKLEPGHVVRVSSFDIELVDPTDSGLSNAMFGVVLKKDSPYRMAVSIGDGFGVNKYGNLPSQKKLKLDKAFSGEATIMRVE